LTITRNAMHFSFEFLVEGTGGSSVFNRFQDKKESDSKNELGSVENLKSNSDVGRGNQAESGDALLKSQSNKIKHHRRWKITRVCSLSLSLRVWICILSVTYLTPLSLCILSVTYLTPLSLLTDKSSSLDTLPTTVYCNRDIL
jgi:hypothetical protein